MSPVGRSHKNDSSSPLDDTVAETPSPGGTGIISPESLRVKVLTNTIEKPFDESSPTKPFDESSPDGKSIVQRDFESIWNADDDMSSDVGHRMKNSKGNARVQAPVPFLSTRLSTQNAQSINRGESPLANQKKSFAPSLSDEIANAHKLGMAETLASAPESAQRALMMQTLSPPATVNIAQFMTSPTSPLEYMSIPSYRATDGKLGVSPAEDANSIKPHSLFRSSKKDEINRSFDEIDQLIARAAEEASIEINPFQSKATPSLLNSKPWKAEDINIMPGEDDMVPFDCTVENISTSNEITKVQCLEEGKNTGKVKKMSVRKILRNANGFIAGITVKKERSSASDLTPNNVMETNRYIRDSSTKVNSSAGKTNKEKFEEEIFAPLSFNADDRSYELRHTIRSGSPGEGCNELSSDEKERGNGKPAVHYICILVVLTIVGILAGLVATGQISFSSKEKSDMAISNNSDGNSVVFTSEATFTPTEIFEESNIFEGSEIIACSNSVPLTEMDRPYYGSNWKAFWDASIDTCGDQMNTGYAVWYSFTTNSSKLVEASTCNNADFDTQITVMSGSCDETMCVSFNDQACGDQSLVTWYAEANTTYHIMVHGYREASGTFGLTLSEALLNDQRANASKLEGESAVAGTTAGATSSVKPPSCDDVDFSGDGVWYEIGNISGFYKAELLLGYTDFSGQVAVYRNTDNAELDSGTLICEKGSSIGSVIWLAEATETYYVYVTGKDGTTGDFDLFFGRNKDSSCTFGTRVDPNSVGYLASTKFSNPQNVLSCGYTGYHTAPGLWFSIMGTGEMLEVSTCGSLLDLDTQISVFGNTCDSLQCIGGTGQDHPCGDNGSVSWQTEKDEVYNIYVSGRSSRVGDFVLNINTVPVADGFTCDGSLTLEMGNTSILSNTTDALSEPVDLCTGSSAVRGVWHTIVGTGMAMKISVCDEKTNFDARVSLFTGSCDGLSCVAYTQSKCGENDEILITTDVGTPYYLFVHGSDSVSIGNYALTIEETVINDSCEMASSLELAASPQYFGSTLSARNSSAFSCSEEPGSESQALWYTLVGTGEIIKLSTCSAETDFSTKIHVFSGSCSDLECISDVSVTSCEGQSMVSFQSAIDEVYYARIGGVNASDAGNFVLEIDPRSRFFGP